jgi:hypothetical protein
MDAKLFWQLMSDICLLGDFIAAIETKGAEINIVGRFQVVHDGFEMVLEKQDCKDHFHIAPEKIQAIDFGYCKNAIGVIEPCIELINFDGQVCLILIYYPYQDKELKPMYEQFMAQHKPYRDVLRGEW